MEENLYKKNFVWNTLGTTLNSFNSLFFLIIVTRLNGLEDGGIFSFSFATAGIINFIALYYGRTYQVSDDNSEFSESTFIVSRFVTSFVAIIIAIIFILLNHYAFNKSMVLIFLCLVKCIEAISDIYYGVVQKKGKLYIAGKSLTFKSFLSLFGFLIIDILTKNIVISCMYLVILNLAFVLLYDSKHAKKEIDIEYKFHLVVIKKLLKLSFFTFLFTLIVMIIINIPRYFIDWLLNDEEQGIYGIISMPATFIMLFAQFILQPSLLKLSIDFKNKNITDFKKTIFKISSIIILSLVAVLPIAYWIGIPVLEIIYNVNLSNYVFYLIIVIIGSDLYAVSNVLLNALIVIKCTREQLILQVIVLIISMLSSYYLVCNFGIRGGILSYFLILLLQFILYIILYKYIVKIKFNE